MDRAEAEQAIRARVQSVYIGQGLVLTRVLGSLKLYLSTSDQGFAGHVMLDGFWESWLTLFLARHIRAGMTVIDVGANFGYYTLLFGDAVGATGHVLAVEPVPQTADILQQSVDLNGFATRTRVVQAAAGSTPASKAHLLIPPREPKNAAVIAAPREGSIEVPATTIDALARDLPRVDLVKIDAEGSELAIITGMQEVIEKHRPAIVLEYNAARYADPAGFLETLLHSYGTVRTLAYDGTLAEITTEDITDPAHKEDRLLYFGQARLGQRTA